MVFKQEIDVFKKPGTKTIYNKEHVDLLIKCQNDPLFFIENFIRVQHPKRGALPFLLYPYQKEIVYNLLTYKDNILMLGRQQGKCSCYNTFITLRHNNIIIKSTIGYFFNHNKTGKLLPECDKFIESYELNGWEIETDNGWSEITKIFKTKPYKIYDIKTEKYTLQCADEHIVFGINYKEIYVKDLKIGDKIITKNGLEKIISINKTTILDNMYDLELNDINHRFYTNGILSHNTITVTAYILWYAMFNSDKTVLIVGNKMSAALEIMVRLRYAYQELPNFIRDSATEYNKSNIMFSNGSRIVCRATTPDAGRGLSISLLYIDEMAYLETKKLQDAFWGSIQPVLSTGGNCIISSTPNSDEDVFSEIWRGANDTILPNGDKSILGKNGFKATFATWKNHPERDEKWADAELNKIGDLRFRREHNCEFIQDEETLIDQIVLSNLKSSEPLFKTNEVRWYKEPTKNNTYVIALDPSLGTGGDLACIQILELPALEQIGEWSSNRADPKKQLQVMQSILIYLKKFCNEEDPEIYWSFENNTIGEGIIQIIDNTGEDKFPGVLLSETHKTNLIRHRKGLTTGNKNKINACMKLKRLMDSGKLKLNSHGLIYQLKNYLRKGNSFEGKLGINDDNVSALLLAIRLIDLALIWSDMLDPDLIKETLDDENGHEPFLIYI